MSTGDRLRVAVVGGALVGALNACFFAKRRFKVDLYESRPDIRLQEVVQGRSINFTLSFRGRESLRAVGLEKIGQNGIAMHAHMIHGKDGSRKPIPYGTKDQAEQICTSEKEKTVSDLPKVDSIPQ